MKHFVLPRKQENYKPKGIYALNISERRPYIEKEILNSYNNDNLREYRINALKEMRGEIYEKSKMS